MESLFSNYHFQNFYLPLLIATGLGALVGAERSYSGRAAGMRTYALVAMSACLLVVVFAQPTAFTAVRGVQGIDPGRVVQGIVTGIGFLGAGVIVRNGMTVKGLTTASAIWATSAIGVICGAQMFSLAGFSTALTLLMLTLARYAETWLPARRYMKLTVTLTGVKRDVVNEFLEKLGPLGWLPAEKSYKVSFSAETCILEVMLTSKESTDIDKLINRIRQIPDVKDFSLEPSKD